MARCWLGFMCYRVSRQSRLASDLHRLMVGHLCRSAAFLRGCLSWGRASQERARAMAEATQSAVQRAVEAGASTESCQVCASAPCGCMAAPEQQMLTSGDTDAGHQCAPTCSWQVHFSGGAFPWPTCLDGCTRVRVRRCWKPRGLLIEAHSHAAHTPGRASAPEGCTQYEYQTLHGYITRCPVIADALYESPLMHGSSKRGLNLLAVYSCRRHLVWWPVPTGHAIPAPQHRMMHDSI